MAGIKPTEYWDLTIGEIAAVIKNYGELEKKRNKDVVTQVYLTASLVANFIGLSMNGKPQPSIEEVFPSVFADEIEELANRKRELEIAKQKERMLNFAMGRNLAYAKTKEGENKN